MLKPGSGSARLSRLLHFSPSILYNLRLVGGRPVPVWVSDNILRITGYTVGEALAPGWWLANLQHATLRTPDDWLRHLLEAGHLTHEYGFRRKDGSLICIRDELHLLYAEDGTPAEIVGSWLDITQQRQGELLRAARNEVLDQIIAGRPLTAILDKIVTRLEELIPQMRGSVLLLDPTTQRLSAGAAPGLPAFYSKAIEGVTIGENVGSCGASAWLGIPVIVDNIPTHPNWTAFRSLAAQAGLQACWSFPFKDENARVLGTFAAYFDHPRRPSAAEFGLIQEFSCIAGLATQQRRAEQQLERLSYYDPLTDLPNRLRMQTSLQHALDQARRHRHGVGVMLIDIDRFKNVNDSLGHAAGDSLLRALARRLQTGLPEAGMLARLGGDEFLFMLEYLDSADEAAAIAQQVITLVQQAFVLPGGQEVIVSASVGVSLYPADGTTVDALLQHAEVALYEAKDMGRNIFCFHSAELTTAVKERLALEMRLRRALERQELCLHYQPQISLAADEPVRAEALLRWHPAGDSPVPPDRFIPLAEETGLIEVIGDWALYEACRQARAWLDAGLRLGSVAVNLSVRQFRQGGLVAQIEAVLNRTGLPAACLELEITESALMDEAGQLVTKLEGLRALGVRLAVDDFGTGYSSLAYLKRLPLDKLKIDQSFVRGLAADNNDQAIVSATIAMARSLGLSTVAEGVETEEQLSMLRALGCNAWQGFLCSPGLPPAAFARLPALAPDA